VKAPQTVALEHEHQTLYRKAPPSGDLIFTSALNQPLFSHQPLEAESCPFLRRLTSL
jgi:hypothetical protein